ncbi:hypothetical protein TYRP_003217 [Tyrophagus putrescentiae]|nr:hypothetical protein TYRP_003217 [Tyrophagus putrescentiae]
MLFTIGSELFTELGRGICGFTRHIVVVVDDGSSRSITFEHYKQKVGSHIDNNLPGSIISNLVAIQQAETASI